MTAQQTANATFTISWPAAGSSSANKTRHPYFVSASTASLTLAVNGGAATTIPNPNIGTTANYTPSTTVTVAAPVGSDTFTVNDYDSSSNLLASNSIVQSIVIDTANTVSLTLNGNLAQLVCAPIAPDITGTDPTFTQSGTSGKLAVMPEDADKNIIVSPGIVPTLTLTGDGTTGSTTTTSTPNEFSVDTISDGVAVTFTASGTNLGGATVSHACTVTRYDLYHPGNNADTFAMSGTLSITYDRANQYPTPEPTSTSFYNVSQSITVANPATYNNITGVDFKISETDAQTAPAAQTFTDTQNQYYQYSNTMYNGNFLNLGYTETDDTGYTATVTNGANTMLSDILPEASGAKWSNKAGRTITTNDNAGQTSTTTYADNGSYTGTITYTNYFDPSPNPTGSPSLTNQATLTANIDGSADYKTPRLGTAVQYNYDYKILAPTAAGSGTISETTTVPPAVGSTSTPEAVTTSIPNWMPATVPGSLASETDVDNGPVALPSPCAVPTSLAGKPNQIVQVKTSVDPLNGELDTTTTTTYDTVNVGPICVILNDVQTSYYDFTGQNGTGYFGGTPQQITTINEVLSLSTESLQSIARRNQTGARVDVMHAANVAIAQTRIDLLHTKARLHRLALSTNRPLDSFRGILK